MHKHQGRSKKLTVQLVGGEEQRVGSATEEVAAELQVHRGERSSLHVCGDHVVHDDQWCSQMVETGGIDWELTVAARRPKGAIFAGEEDDGGDNPIRRSSGPTRWCVGLLALGRRWWRRGSAGDGPRWPERRCDGDGYAQSSPESSEGMAAFSAIGCTKERGTYMRNDQRGALITDRERCRGERRRVDGGTAVFFTAGKRNRRKRGKKELPCLSSDGNGERSFGRLLFAQRLGVGDGMARGVAPRRALCAPTRSRSVEPCVRLPSGSREVWGPQASEGGG